MRILEKVYSSTIQTLTRKGQFLNTRFPSIPHSYSIPIPRTERTLVTCTTDAYMSPKICNIGKLLSTNKRDFLIRNNGQKVKIDILNGKFVALLYMEYPTHRNAPNPLGLLEAYKTLYPKGDFEVVFVACTEKDDDNEDSYEWFNKYFLNMPWLGVPFSDFGTSKSVRDVIVPCVHRYASYCLILDKLGNVVCDEAQKWFDIHGANWYPFTKKRIDELAYEGKSADDEFSLKELLSSPSCDYVLTKNRDKVSIADLESKVVGLYFYDWRSDGEVSVTVRSVYDELKAKGLDFEIVFINRYCSGGYPDEESFNKYLEKMPWLALPFGERTCEKLAYELAPDTYSFCTDMVIWRKNICEIYALDIIADYGLDAYPFTVEKAAELEIEKLSLFSIFNTEGQEFVIQNDSNKTKIKVSNLKSAACMLVASNVPFETLSYLINWFDNLKRVDDDFEVIYVSECESVSEYDDMLKQMPSAWLALPFGVGHKISSMFKSWKSFDIKIAAFKPDGKYLTLNFPEDKDDWELLSNSSYPYNVYIDTVQEMRFQLINYNNWY